MKHFLTFAKATLLFFFLFVSNTATVFAQWEQVGYMIANTDDTISGSPTHNNILGFGSSVYCCTDSGLFASADNGDTWLNITQSHQELDHELIYSFFVAGNGDWYLGSHRRLYKSDNSGSSWTWLNTLPDNLTFNGIAEIGGNIVVSYNISFSNGGAYYSANGGTSWTQATGLPAAPMFYMQVKGAEIYLGGKDGVYVSTDNGQSWAVAGTGQPTSCRFFDVDESGGNLFAGDINGLGMWASYDDGATWQNPAPTLFSGFCQVFAITAAHDMILAAMDGSVCNAGGGQGIKLSTDNGQTWNAFMNGLEPVYHSILGKNADGSAFFAKQGGNRKKVYRYTLSTAIAQETKSAVKVMVQPNPFSTQTTLILEGLTEPACDFRLYDLAGRELETIKITSSSFTLQTTGLGKGIYLYRLDSAGNTVAQGKLVVE